MTGATWNLCFCVTRAYFLSCKMYATNGFTCYVDFLNGKMYAAGFARQHRWQKRSPSVRGKLRELSLKARSACLVPYPVFVTVHKNRTHLGRLIDKTRPRCILSSRQSVASGEIRKTYQPADISTSLDMTMRRLNMT